MAEPPGCASSSGSSWLPAGSAFPDGRGVARGLLPPSELAVDVKFNDGDFDPTDPFAPCLFPLLLDITSFKNLYLNFWLIGLFVR